ncbi:MAG: Asp23/Gls24 family envelope stress response protein [Firmicutes bacterium]|nr:Asp23/Gls24 family envelope stress response protein [Bacillota bacterium]
MEDQILEVEVQNQEDASTIKIADDVVATIAGIAASEIDGVVGMSGGVVSGISQILGKKQLTKGVKVAITDADVVLDISIVVEYGKKIPEVAGAIQKAVASAVGDMTGLNVVAVNVHVAAVQFVEPAAEEAPAAEQEAAEQA